MTVGNIEQNMNTVENQQEISLTPEMPWRMVGVCYFWMI